MTIAQLQARVDRLRDKPSSHAYLRAVMALQAAKHAVLARRCDEARR